MDGGGHIPPMYSLITPLCVNQDNSDWSNFRLSSMEYGKGCSDGLGAPVPGGDAIDALSLLGDIFLS
jgi:hypothetical protein